MLLVAACGSGGPAPQGARATAGVAVPDVMRGIAPIRWRDGIDGSLFALNTPCEPISACRFVEMEHQEVERLVGAKCPDLPECPEALLRAVAVNLNVAFVERWYLREAEEAAQPRESGLDAVALAAFLQAGEEHREQMVVAVDHAVELGERLVQLFPDGRDDGAGRYFLADALARQIGLMADLDARAEGVGRLVEVCDEIVSRGSIFTAFAHALLAEHSLWESRDPSAALAYAEAGLRPYRDLGDDFVSDIESRSLLEYHRGCALLWLGRRSESEEAFRAALAGSVAHYFPPDGFNEAARHALEVVLDDLAVEPRAGRLKGQPVDRWARGANTGR